MLEAFSHYCLCCSRAFARRADPAVHVHAFKKHDGLRQARSCSMFLDGSDGSVSFVSSSIHSPLTC